MTRSIADSYAAALAGASFRPVCAGAGEITVAGVPLVADLAGALYWPEEGLLVVSDLHLEKGSAFAVRGVLMPPYDTAATLGAAGRPACALCRPHRRRARRQFP